MKKLPLMLMLLLVLLACGAYLYCGRYQKIEVKDVKMTQRLTLSTKDKYVVGLEAYIEGYLDDTAKIGSILIGKGDVKASLYSGDFYNDTLPLQYQPYKAKNGKLTIKYRFRTY